MTICTLSYRSRGRLAELNLDPVHELTAIVHASQSRNAKAGVTGAMLFHENSFLQILEGDKESVEEIFESIERDPRHAGIAVLALQAKPRRRFDPWSMACVGKTRQARVYYRYFTHKPDFHWDKLDNDVVSDLMLNMMDLDHATFLSSSKGISTGEPRRLS